MKCFARLTIIVALGFSGYSWSQTASVVLDFDQPDLRQLDSGATIFTQFEQPDSVPGVVGSAWRADGFSSWLSLPTQFNPATGFSVSFWLALESYPSDLEVTVQNLSPSSMVQQWDANRGFDLWIDTYGRWGLKIATEDGLVDLRAPDNFPVYEWAHVGFRVDVAQGEVQLLLNGAEVAEARFDDNTLLRLADAPLELARSASEVGFLNFTFNRLNGSYDDLKIFAEPVPVDLVTARRLPQLDVMDSLVVAPTRFASDFLRPSYRAMPPANWTNEPHGLVRREDRWHLFYQRTPNGPYKTQMHWGHMYSDDLVHWINTRDAFWPELQTENFGFDQKGIWSGDVILDGDTAFAFYTSVNHFDRLAASNPGVAMATSTDENLEYWEKFGPIINTEHVLDFRDPYLWKHDGTWHMLIGAALESGGGLDYHVLSQTEDGAVWEHRPRFTSISYRILDIGSIIWEMPVFEALTEDVYVLKVNPIGGAVQKYGEPATRGVYWTGTWDGEEFEPAHREPKMLDILPGHLAPTVARAEDGTIRAIGIVDERRTPQSQEDAGWAHTFSVPRTWFLMPDGETMGQAPAPEYLGLRGDRIATDTSITLNEEMLRFDLASHSYELELNVASLNGGDLAVDLLATADREELTRLVISNGRVVLDKTESSKAGEDEGPLYLEGDYDVSAFGQVETVRIFVDGSVVDVFINDAAAFAFRTYPSRADSHSLYLSSGSSAMLNSLNVWGLGN